MTSPAKPLRFTRLYLENWRNFARLEADLARRVLITGPNACGKSNLLDAFRFLRDIAAAGGFQKAVFARGGISRIRCLAARQHTRVAVAVCAGSDESGTDWEYELQFEQEDQRMPSIRRERVTRAGEDILVRPDEADAADPARLTQTALEQVYANREFRELAAFFGSVAYVNTVPQLVREPERSAGRHDDPFGGDLLEQIARTSEHVRAGRLRRILEALQAAVPHLEALELHRDRHGAPHLRARYAHWRSQGAWQTEEQFSDGTLRLLGLLWSALGGSGPLLAEEPELSLHPEIAARLLPVIRAVQRRTQRQILLTTHSKDLLSDERIDLSELLLLVPGEEGTVMRRAVSLDDAGALLEGRLAAEPAVSVNDDQLVLFEHLEEPAAPEPAAAPAAFEETQDESTGEAAPVGTEPSPGE